MVTLKSEPFLNSLPEFLFARTRGKGKAVVDGLELRAWGSRFGIDTPNSTSMDTKKTTFSLGRVKIFTSWAAN